MSLWTNNYWFQNRAVIHAAAKILPQKISEIYIPETMFKICCPKKYDTQRKKIYIKCIALFNIWALKRISELVSVWYMSSKRINILLHMPKNIQRIQLTERNLRNTSVCWLILIYKMTQPSTQIRTASFHPRSTGRCSEVNYASLIFIFYAQLLQLSSLIMKPLSAILKLLSNQTI